MKKYSRYAIYYAPPKESSLEEFGRYWFGWDPLNAKLINNKQRINYLNRFGIEKLKNIDENVLIAKKYWFHGTLIPPFKLNKNLKRLARKSALSIQAKENNIIVVEDFNFESPKTKNFAAVLQAFGLENKKSILVLAESNNNVYLSSRNLKSTKTVTNSGLSTYELLNANKVILSEGALEGIESNLSK